MTIKEVLAKYASHPAVKRLGRAVVDDSHRHIRVDGLYGSAPAVAFSALLYRRPALHCPLLFVMDDAEEAGYLCHDMVQMLGERRVFYFPSSFRRAIKFGQRDAASEILRTEVLDRLANWAPGEGSVDNEKLGQGIYVVTYPDALAELVVRKEAMEANTLPLSVGQTIGMPEVEGRLIELGFKCTDYVYEPGQFAVRGSLLDVYSFSCENPYRIDFFGDEVDSIRTFEVESQLSVNKHQMISLIPEFSVTNTLTSSILSFLPTDTLIVTRDAADLCNAIDEIYRTGFTEQALIEEHETMGDAEDADRQQLLCDKLLVRGEEFSRGFADFRRLILRPTHADAVAKVKGEKWTNISFHTAAQPIYHKNFDLVNESFLDFIRRGYHLYILADSQKQNDRLKAIFDDQGHGITFTPVDKTLHAGFSDDDLQVCLFTDHQVFDRFHKYNLRSDRARSGKVALTLKEIQQFELGDYVVHIDHGIGRFGGLARIPNGDRLQEVIKVVYANNDTVFVSIHALHKLSKYRGKDGVQPRLSTLGSGAWDRLKEKTKKRIKDIARDLILLYSRRRKERGFAFSPDHSLQHELEASFLYEDTPDQLKATNDVKADMEKALPMDRLVCGDVGFGKTEVAIRAAFKACLDGKQVAVLVPTTVLAYQHFRTFQSRLKKMPVRVDYLSRARTTKQTREVLKDLEAGRIDILVGTHKLVSKSVKFKDLGLLIIDEEQKFGVSTKEKLRQMKTNVDTLTLTATPIPRTLQFSLMGARDLSVIQTPPPNRYPIQTELHTFSAEVICDAINFEMSRNGQVFIISNRISSLPELEATILKRIPDARICIGHGQMPSEQLEEIILGFANYDYDVLICTTIIESGVDIPNANTIIINGAQNFGLSDLHQMRGRVGRGNKKAFCYLLAPPLHMLTPEARRRLQAIENFSGLGSGIHIAMQDLDIRGAGNLLGAEQSGFIADLGYETYQKILSEAVKELRNDEFNYLYEEKQEEGQQLTGEEFVGDCLLESNLPMFFSDTYVPGSSERMLLYRELDSLERDAEVERFRQRLIDRFGPVPEEGEELIRVVRLRRLGKYFGAERIVLKGGQMKLFFVANKESAFYASLAFDKIIQFVTTNVHCCALQEKRGSNMLVISGIHTVRDAVAILEQIQSVGG